MTNGMVSLNKRHIANLLLLMMVPFILAGCSGQISPNAGQVLINLSNSVPGIWRLITGGAYLLGIMLVAKAVFQLKIYGEMRTMMSSQTNIKSPITLLLVAAVFLYLPTAFNVLMQSSFGYSSAVDPMNWSGPSIPGLNQQATVAMVKLVQLVGLIAFVRGWYIIAKASQQGAQVHMGKGLTHIIGGILAINIVGTQQVLSATFGI